MKNLNSLGLTVTDGVLKVLDQTLLPHGELWLTINSIEDMDAAIKRLAVRGAPLIGIAAALTLALRTEEKNIKQDFLKNAALLRKSRPTAVNLMNAIDRMIHIAEITDFSKKEILIEAEKIFEEDVEFCSKMAEFGEPLIHDGDGILTHCNTGGLVTAGTGTALGVIRKAHENKKKIHVYVDETRPLLQGARLTTWELQKLKIPFTLICDNMAASLMAQGKIQKVFTGADRIAKNGDTANKIGTYSVAVNAAYHRIPFYIVAPKTTFDLKCEKGANIPIEERLPQEVRGDSALQNSPVYNPSFDVTPRSLITGIVTESGIL